MPEPRFLDFDLALQEEPGGSLQAWVIKSPAGEARRRFEFPFSDIETENFLLRLGNRNIASVRRLESPSRQSARIFGSRLFEALFGDEVEDCFRQSMAIAEREGVGLRLRLRLEGAPSFAGIPWEFLFDATNDRYVALSSWSPLTRYVDLPRSTTPLAVAPPIRVLVMISSPTDYPALDVEGEWGRLSDGLGDLVSNGSVELHRVDDASLGTLRRALLAREHHVFHFIGHGGFDEAAGEGVLVLESESGRAQVVAGRDVGTLLHDHRSLRLAVLNSCEGARASAADPLGGVAQTLLRVGIPAVVAMQFEISDGAALSFAHAFYDAVAGGLPVDMAVTEGRKAVFGDDNQVEWGTPVLYIRSAEAKIFDVSQRQRQSAAPVVRPEEPIAEASVARGAPPARPGGHTEFSGNRATRTWSSADPGRDYRIAQATLERLGATMVKASAQESEHELGSIVEVSLKGVWLTDKSATPLRLRLALNDGAALQLTVELRLLRFQLPLGYGTRIRDRAEEIFAVLDEALVSGEFS